MKKLLILIVFGAVYLHYYPQPELEQWFEDKKSEVIEEVSEATETHIRLKADKILEDLQGNLHNFSEDEQKYLKKVTSDSSSVKDFFEENCEQDARNDSIAKANLSKVCQVMQKYQSLM